MNLKKFKLDSYNKIIDDYSNNHELYMFFLYPLIFKLKKQDIKNYNYSIFLKLKKKQPLSFNEYNVIKKYTKKNLDKDIRSTIKCIFWSDYIDKNNIYAIYYVKKHLSTKKQTPINLINLLYRLLTNAPTKISGGKTHRDSVISKIISKGFTNISHKISNGLSKAKESIFTSKKKETISPKLTETVSSIPQHEQGIFFKKYNKQHLKQITVTEINKYNNISDIEALIKNCEKMIINPTKIGNELIKKFLAINDKYRRHVFYNLGYDINNDIIKSNKNYIIDRYYDNYYDQIILKKKQKINNIDFYTIDIFLMLNLYFNNTNNIFDDFINNIKTYFIDLKYDSIFQPNEYLSSQIKNIYKLLAFNILEINIFKYNNTTLSSSQLIKIQDKGYFQYLLKIFDDFKILFNKYINDNREIVDINKNDFKEIYIYILKLNKDKKISIEIIFFNYLLNYNFLFIILPILYNIFLNNQIINDTDIIYGCVDYMIKIINDMTKELSNLNDSKIQKIIDEIDILKHKLNIFKYSSLNPSFLENSNENIISKINSIITLSKKTGIKMGIKSEKDEKIENEEKKQDQDKFYETILLTDLIEYTEIKEQYSDKNVEKIKSIINYINIKLFLMIKHLDHLKNYELYEKYANLLQELIQSFCNYYHYNIDECVYFINILSNIINNKKHTNYDEKYNNIYEYINRIYIYTKNLNTEEVNFYIQYYIQAKNIITKYKSNVELDEIYIKKLSDDTIREELRLKIEIQYGILINDPVVPPNLVTLGLNSNISNDSIVSSSGDNLYTTQEKIRKIIDKVYKMNNFTLNDYFLKNNQDYAYLLNNPVEKIEQQDYYADEYEEKRSNIMSRLNIKEGGSSKIGNVKLQLLLNYIISHISSKK
jgi:hypothetical protein